ncbi:MAG: hypothetical protein U9Q07_13470, partial [Planctomycetota bacterium]|nr:hypothetical protein [Planctomycetota bacterium]
MTSEETIEERLEKLAQAISPDETLVENVMSRIDTTPIARLSIGPSQNIWRTIMKSPIAKSAAAAVIVIACSGAWMLWKSTGSGIALADVLTRIEQVTAYSYQMQSTVKNRQISTESVITVLISKEYGMKMVRNTIDPQSGKIKPTLDTYLSHKPNSITYVNHEGKMYLKLEYDDDKIRFYREECNDPRIIIKQFLGCNHTSLGQS